MENEYNGSFLVTDLAGAVTEILEEGRRIIDDAVDDLMIEAFERVGDLILSQEQATGRKADINGAMCGLSKQVLQDIYGHAQSSTVASWILEGADGKKVRLRMDFLNYDRMKIMDFKAAYPRAFTKWTPEEDDELVRLYRTALSLCAPGARRIPWSNISARMGRNPNAIKLRLEHLGFDLGSEAGIPRHSRLAAPRAEAKWEG